MVLKNKLVTEEDVDRVYTKYIIVNDKLVNDLGSTNDVDTWRNSLFEATVQGFDISFVLTYDWAIERLVEKITKGKKGGEKQEEFDFGKVEEVKFKPLKKVKWGKYERTAQVKYKPREVQLLNRLIDLGYKKETIFVTYSRIYDERTKQAIYRKVLRMEKL